MMVDLTEFFSLQIGILRQTPKKYRRFLYEKINWESRLIGIVGGRGTGKTTILLQHLNAEKKAGVDILYISADHIRVEALGLYEIGATFFKTGGQVLAIDEIHKYNNWAQEVKNLYDSFPKARLLFSGNSSLHLQLGKADLSRRAVYYTLPVLSFREYLRFDAGVDSADYQLSEILQNHSNLTPQIQPEKPILGLFRDYLAGGAYPFFLEGKKEYHAKLRNIIQKVLYEDIPATTGMRFSGIPALKKILYEISTSPPFELNIDRLANNLGIARPTVYAYLEHLEQACLIIKVMPKGAGASLTRKPAKLYLANTNLLKAIGMELQPEDPVGTVRENFFANQVVGANYIIRAVKKRDFLVADKYLFEIGGKSKSRRQIKEHEHSFVVKDDIETGFGNIIPLWLFGFMY